MKSINTKEPYGSVPIILGGSDLIIIFNFP